MNPNVRPGRLAVRHDPDPAFPGGYSILSPVTLPGEGFSISRNDRFPGAYVLEMVSHDAAIRFAQKLAAKHYDRLLADAATQESCS